MYAEFGATATDSAKITLTYGAAGISTEKSFNILARQISCTATWRSVNISSLIGPDPSRYSALNGYAGMLAS